MFSLNRILLGLKLFSTIMFYCIAWMYVMYISYYVHKMWHYSALSVISRPMYCIARLLSRHNVYSCNLSLSWLRIMCWCNIMLYLFFSSKLYDGSTYTKYMCLWYSKFFLVSSICPSLYLHANLLLIGFIDMFANA